MKYRNTLKNKTYRYVFPMIEDIVNYEKGLKACYIRDINKSQYLNHIFLQYELSTEFKDLYLKFEEEIHNSELFEEFYDLKDGTIMFVFKVPEKYQEDYKTFINSKYSQFSTDYKHKLIDFHGKINEDIIRGTLFKTEKRFKHLDNLTHDLHPKRKSVITQDMEFDSRWEPENEFFEFKNMLVE